MILPKWLVTVTFFSKTLAFILFITLPVIAFVLGVQFGKLFINTSSEPFANVSTKLNPSPILQDSKALTYLNGEYSLLKKNTIGNKQISYYFGVKINQFHPDWTCLDSLFTNEGLTIFCSQTPCIARENLKWPDKNYDVKSCQKELDAREYPNSFSSLEIKAKEYQLTSGITNFNQILTQPNIKKTPKGIYYLFTKKPVKKYTYQYSVVFYSPIEVGNVLNNFQGDLFGQDRLNYEYSINTTISADNISDEKIDTLFTKIIDSIEFLRADNTPVYY